MSEDEPEAKEKRAKPVRSAAVPLREERDAASSGLKKERREVSLKMSEGCTCPMWEPEKREKWKKWVKERIENMKEMGCMCPMWEVIEEKEEEKGEKAEKK